MFEADMTPLVRRDADWAGDTMEAMIFKLTIFKLTIFKLTIFKPMVFKSDFQPAASGPSR
jgi:hypothetical protein